MLGVSAFAQPLALIAQDAKKPDQYALEAKMVDVTNSGKTLFDVLGANANVYIGRVVKRELTPPYGYYDQGKLTLSIEEVLRGVARENVILPYSIDIGGDFKVYPHVWQPLLSLGGRRALCVVVPNAFDRFAGGVQSGLTEAAFLVVALDESGNTVRDQVGARYDKRDTEVLYDMKRILKLYDMQDKKELIETLKVDMADTEPMVRDFAYQAAAIKLGAMAPDDALNLLHTQASQAKEGDEGVLRLVDYLKTEHYLPASMANPANRSHSCCQ